MLLFGFIGVTMFNQVCDIKNIQFGVLSNEEIVKRSVVEIYNSKLTGSNSVYDERMGFSFSTNGLCVTCHKTYKDCVGHFGHIILNEDILHPLYLKTIVKMLKCFCFNPRCNRLLTTREHLMNPLDINGGKLRDIDSIYEILIKREMCSWCSFRSPKIVTQTVEKQFMIKSKIKEGKSVKCEVLQTKQIYEIFNGIRDSDLELLGIDPTLFHPRNLIMSVFPVLPPCCRPHVMSDDTICDDDLTIQLIEIVKNNNNLKERKSSPDYERYKYNVQFRIATFFNNTAGKAKHASNGGMLNARPIKCLKQRLSGKQGQIRNNILGKRVNFSARTVISPGPDLKVDELSIPVSMTREMTFPEHVTMYNKKYLQGLLESGQCNYVIKKNGIKFNISYGIDNIKLELGDVVERHLKNGDIVLLNRQPTLHRGGMMAMKIKIGTQKTIRFNLACTALYNADFDGDEMNIHPVRSYETKAELMELAGVDNNIILSQTSKNGVKIVQDGLLGSFMMSKGYSGVPRGEYYNMCMEILAEDGNTLWNNERCCHIRNIMKQEGKPETEFTGKGLISLLLPNDFNFYKKTSYTLEPETIIKKGVLVSGVFNKDCIGSSSNSVIQVLYKEYPLNTVMNFINNIQFLAVAWLKVHAFSIGLGDCRVRDQSQTTIIKNIIDKCYIEAKGVEQTQPHPVIREIRVNAALSKAKDAGLKIAKDSLDSDNNFVQTVTAGSKGDFFNIAQITGLLGQQHLNGERMKPTNKYDRTLPHYEMKDLSISDTYESRGFIKSSFIEGVNPTEYFFHCIAGRNAVCDTATSTPKSGYIQRKIVKLHESIVTQQDKSTRTLSGNIHNYIYGLDGTDPTKQVKLSNGKMTWCNVNRLAEQLNNQWELRPSGN